MKIAKKRKAHHDIPYDALLASAKRPGQAVVRDQVERGERSQESLFFISREDAQQAVVRHRVLSF